ncbi:GTPase Era, mitochondrial [Culicoides brevitarsis]|uniref:GTPase Era, mitochondrial n=1 Tax=Culicoides brevitarsis TaxID=469753 RepID=UPI00307B48D1
MIVRRFLFQITRNSEVLKSLPIVRAYNTSENRQKEEENLFESTLENPQRASKESPHEKLIRVAIVGVPNAGKSTLINTLAEHRICPVSSKVHTTRNFSRAICVKDNTQIVFFDTPGLVKEREIKKHHLEKSFVSAYRHSIQNADLIAVLHDVSNRFTRDTLDKSVLEALHQYPKVPSILILNKIDCLKSKRILLSLVGKLTKGYLNGEPFGDKFEKKSRRKKSAIQILDELKRQEMPKKDEEQTAENPDVENPRQKETGWDKFQQVFMVSALNGDGVPKLTDFLCSEAKNKPWLFDADTYTDRTPEELIVQSVRAKLLDFLPQEIPYSLSCAMEFYTVEKGQIFASVLITCPNKRIEKLVCGNGNGKLRQITEMITSDLIETFEAPFSLTISTKSKSKD